MIKNEGFNNIKTTLFEHFEFHWPRITKKIKGNMNIGLKKNEKWFDVERE